MTCKIRTLKKQDIEGLRALCSSASEYILARQISDYWLYSKLFNSTCIVAIAHSTIVGAALGFLNQGDDDDLYLQDLVVSKDFRHQGIGTLLMEEIINRATTLHATSLWLTSHIDNIPATMLWRKFGFINKQADYQHKGFWVSKDFKGEGMDRVVFQLTI